MSRWINDYTGKLVIDSLRDLKRGDKVYITYWGGKYIPATVTRVKTVECATIITIKKIDKVKCTKFVGYYTESVAMNNRRTMLTINNVLGNCIEETLEEADDISTRVVKRAEALTALRTIKNWLFSKEVERTYEPVE